MNLEFWIIFAIIAFILELLTLTFFMLSIGAGSVCAAMAAYYGHGLTTQIMVFVAAAILCIIILKPLGKRLNKDNPNKKSNTGRLVGKTAIVTKKITPLDVGKVLVENESWLAVSNKTINIDTEVTVAGIDGVKLVVE